VQNKIHHALDHQKKRVRVYGEEFLSGIFATLLATPCTAPFLGTTLAYALAHDTIYIFILFFMLGFGFAFPYIIGMILPASLMPKPKGGPWLTWVSRILAVGLIMSAMWLIWVFSEINGLYAAFGISLSLLAIMACLFLQRKYRLCKWLLLPLALSVVLVPIFIEERQEIQHATLDEVWHAFEPERIEEIVNSGKIVVVDITASWCVTCKVNKSRVLLDPSISTILSSDKIYCMRADWTNKDNKIAKYLASYKRYGIPFNQVFGPLQKQGIILPEFLDKESILRAIEKVGYEE
jgi:suppressor for copper-sensitivity B